MFARINCPSCQHKLTIPEGDMGKRHTCPNCKSPFVAGKTDGEVQGAEVAMKPQPAADSAYNKTMLGGDAGPPIKFGCPRCKKAIEVPSIEAGTKRACPGCGQRLQVPAAPSTPVSAPAGLNKTVLASDESSAEPIRYNCPNCKKPMESPAIEALSKKNCPACGQRFQIPATSTSGAPRPNLSKTVLASDESKAPPGSIQVGQTAAAAAGATSAPAGTAPASDTTPVTLNVSKRQLLIGGGVLAVGLLFLLLIACVASIFIGSGGRAEAKELEALKTKLLKDQQEVERRAEQEKRDHEIRMAELRNQGVKANQIKDAEDVARQKQLDHERELARIREQAAAAAAAAARPAWYRGGYWYGGHWYPY